MLSLFRSLPDRRFKGLLSAADEANRRRQWETARNLYARVLAIDPLRSAIHVQHGHALKELGRLGEAEAAYREAIRTAPDAPDPLLQLARVLEMSGRGEEAREAWEGASRLDPAGHVVQHRNIDVERPDPAGDVLLLDDAKMPSEAPFAPVRAAGVGVAVGTLGLIRAEALPHPVVSFDIFGTLLRRRHLRDHEVHDAVSAYVLALLGLHGREQWCDLTRTRYGATERMKGSPSLATEEPSLLLIWTQLVRPYVASGADAEAVALKAVAFEFELERENLVLVEGAEALLTALHASGRKLIAITDMYFDQGKIETLLRDLGILQYIARVFDSCEVGLTKQTGNLFSHVLSELGVEAAQVIHIGDNVTSDYNVPLALGWDAIHIEHYNGPSPPPFGHRADIHHEVSDLLKLFAAVVSIQALNDRSEHVYFLTRDGVLAREALQRWSLPAFTDHLRPDGVGDLSISRSVSCWLNLDFSRDWLSQAIGHAIWLGGGQATVQDVAGILDVAEGAPAAGTAAPVDGDHAPVLAELWRAAGLEDAVRSTLLDRRAILKAYLQSQGFFGRRRVTICDVGYSGTVVRDLNIALLQEGGADRSVPLSTFHVIASNHHHGPNKSLAKPYVAFSDSVLLPAASLPQELLDSFAWLEYFFKHPTLGPLLGYREKGGQVEPVFAEKPLQASSGPFERVLAQIEGSSQDIILLFMALTSQWESLARPLIQRFAHPDLQTVQQMADPVYEEDALGRHTRSIVIADTLLSDEAIRALGRSKDYWIPGSLVASRLARQQDALEDFDTDFYIAFYEDLRGLPDHATRVAHYRAHGQAEGRFRSHDHMIRVLEAKYGSLPSYFDAGTYLWLNPDIPRHSFPHAHAIVHYQKHGRSEGRNYRARPPELEAQFDTLATAGALDLTPEEDLSWRDGELTACELMFRRHGISMGPWLDHLHAREFEALNFDWCGPLANRADAVLAFLRQGVERLAALSLKSAFDPHFYRLQQHLTRFSEQRAFQHWLEVGSLLRYAPSEAYYLQHLIFRPDYPSSFDWRGYAASTNGRLQDSHRVDVLNDLLVRGDPLSAPGFVDAADARAAAAFLGVFAHGAASRGRTDAAEKALARAVEFAPGDGRLWHELGELHRAAGRRSPALNAYRQGAGSQNPNRWTFIHGAQLAADGGSFGIAKRFIEEGRDAWKGMSIWRDTRWRILKLEFDDAVLRLRATSETYVGDHTELAQGLLGALLREGPATLSLASVDGPQLVLTGKRRSARLRAFTEAETTIAGGRPVSIFYEDEAAQFREALAGASVAVFHDLAPSAEVVRAMAHARGLSVPTVCWFGEPGALPEFGVDIAAMAWEDPLGDGLAAFDVRTLVTAAMTEAVVSAFPTLLPTLEAGVGPQTLVRLAASVRLQAAEEDDAASVRLLLVAPSAGAGQADSALRAVIGRLLASHPDLQVIVANDSELARGHPGAAARVSSAGMLTHWSASVLAAAVDLVVDLQPSTTIHSLWCAAAHAGRPTLLGPAWRSSWFSDAAAITSDLDGIEEAANGLIDDRRRRTALGRRAQQLFHRRYAAPGPDPRLPRAAATGRDGRRRVLLANVFFPPQITGGASRVLADNLDRFLDTVGETMAFTVLASDEGNPHVGEVSVEEYRGSAVYRIATPQEANMDWRSFNADVEPLTRRICRVHQPELVHLHAIQRVTLALPEYCLAHEIPYIVTLHDAWWLSDYPFLTDLAGDPARPRRNPLSEPSLPSVPLAASVERALRVRRVLEGARALLGVSETFSELFRRAGYDVRTLANGTSRLPRTARRPGSGRVRLGHIGGLETHKGAFLIEAVLKTQRFENLSLLVTDLSRDHLDAVETTWGTTPVTIQGKTPAQQVGALYSGLDVLLAPSTWPESYGLVSREALAQGLWVIGGAQGAMAEDLAVGLNGFRIDTSSPLELMNVLRTIDNDPDTYRRSPDLVYTGRTTDQQADELIQLYGEIMK